MKRLFDILMAVSLLITLSVPMVVIALLIKLTSKGPILYWSDRVGRNNIVFKMPKFRTMIPGTPEVATHLINEPGLYLEPLGYFLRKTGLDELPQLVSILRGEMSLVGPRPALYNQDDLVALRSRKNIERLVPGVTGWAQINGDDCTPVAAKVELDEYYHEHRSFLLDLKILFLTIIKKWRFRG